MFYPAGERSRVEVDQWLFRQMAGLGPMADQAHRLAGRRDSIPEGRVRAGEFLAGGPEGYGLRRRRCQGFIGDKIKEAEQAHQVLFGQRTQ